MKRVKIFLDFFGKFCGKIRFFHEKTPEKLKNAKKDSNLNQQRGNIIKLDR